MTHYSFDSDRFNSRAFTLMEIVVSISIIGIIAAFGGANYAKAINKTAERDAINQLMTIHAAQMTYNQNVGEYYPTSANVGIAAINTNLGLNILANAKFSMNCNSTDPASYECYYMRKPKGDATITWVIRINQDVIAATNPCCFSAAACPSLPAC